MVIDASALIELLLRTKKGRKVAEIVQFSHGSLQAPHLICSEVLNVLRRSVRAGLITDQRATQAVDLFASMDIEYHGQASLTPVVWELRNNVSAYDATYVALAKQLERTLVTADAKLAAALGDTVALRLVE